MTEVKPNILEIKSKKSELKKVEKFISNVFATYQLKKECFNKVLLCVTEAVINSIIHGNKGDHTKKVELTVNCKTHLISVKITDEGEGFDVNNLPNPIQKDNLLKESGRGIHIIRTIANEVSFNEKGNQLQFEIECK
uniref:ATP-binding protein n=1 Tax=uncultured Draconibacterium sp. TaxID=1573823 RepID=UPI00321756D5